MSFVGDMYQRRFTKEGKKARKDAAAVVAKTKEDSAKAKANSLFFDSVPTKEMTGVEPHMTRLCSTLSQQLYTKNSTEQFQLSTKDNKAEVLIYDNHGELKEATVPFAAVISGDTMILGWRGTSGLADMLNDAAASPQSSFAWRKHAKTIKAHGGFTSIVHNDLVTHEAELIKC